MRRSASGALSGTLLNLAQVGFAKTFNLLYQQRATDVNIMFYVARDFSQGKKLHFWRDASPHTLGDDT